jgi:hypothetical protein
MPGRGAPGAGAPGMAGGLAANRATISARGGTTGRATGCPAKFGLAGGRRGCPPPTGIPAGAAGAGADGPGRAAGRGGAGIAGTVPGRGAPGIAMAGGAPAPGAGLGASATPGGSGCRGPDKICPGLGGGGAERAGMAGPRLTGILGIAGRPVGCPLVCPMGCPVDKGGRRGNAERTGAGGSSAAPADSLVGSSPADGAPLLALGCAGGRAASGAGTVAVASTLRPGCSW